MQILYNVLLICVTAQFQQIEHNMHIAVWFQYTAATTTNLQISINQNTKICVFRRKTSEDLSFYCDKPDIFIIEDKKNHIIPPTQHAHRFFHLGGTCTLLPSFMGVHPNFWGCNVPSNSSFGGTKKINCIFSTQGRAPCCFL